MFKKKPTPEHLKETVIPEKLQNTVTQNSDAELAKTVVSKPDNVNLNYLMKTVSNSDTEKKSTDRNSVTTEDLLEMIEALQEEVKYLRKQINVINEKID